MLERFTVDVLAEHVATQLLEGEPTPKLSHRFFRKGRRDGKKAYDHASVSKLLTDAVHLAGSTLVEDLTSARRNATLRLADCEAAIEKHSAMLAAPDVPDTQTLPGPEADPKPVTENGDSAQLLADALEARKALRARRESDARNAEARARQQSRTSALEAAETAATHARADISRLQSELVGLPDEFRQRFESIKHTGELLWSRYCNGFVQGVGRRGSRASDVETPAGTLSFATPVALVDDDAIQVEVEDS